MNKIVLTQKNIEGYILDICRQISNSNWKPDYIVGITRGGLTPAVLISHYLDVPLQTLKISLRDHESCESNLWMAEDAFNSKNILVVDDINDTGATFNWIMKDWQSSCDPHNHDVWDHTWGDNVRFAVLVDNLASQCNIGMYYVGMEINKAENNVWIEFPWENFWTK